MAKVQLQHISRRFGSTVAINDITFEVPDGQFWVLVGPSGCGKSTVLRTIAGLEQATSGDLYIGDRRVNQIPARQRDVAMVFQNYALYPHMSVAENLAFGLQMRKADAKTIQERVASVAELLNLEPLLDRKPRQLSGGQQQRVALGRAIARQPQVFLLDEPLSNLDAQLRDDTRAELKQLHEQVNITTIYVTHDQVEAMTLADQIVVLNQGQIQQIGDPQTIYSQPANRMVATFIGTPPMNILRATFRDGSFWINEQAVPCIASIYQHLQPLSGQEFDLGIRSEHLQLASENCHLIAHASVLEPLGRETLIRAIVPAVNGAAQTLMIQTSPNYPIRVGDRLPIRIALEHLLVFDTETGQVLYSGKF